MEPNGLESNLTVQQNLAKLERERKKKRKRRAKLKRRRKKTKKRNVSYIRVANQMLDTCLPVIA